MNQVSDTARKMTQALPGEKVFDLNGIKVAVNKEIASETIMKAISNGSYERAEAAEIKRIVQPKDRIVELGGGLGYISSMVAKLKIAASIDVFEANPALLPVMQRNHYLNDVSVNVHNAVVLPAHQVEKVPFYVREHFWASSLSPQPWGYRSTVQVETRDFYNVLRTIRPTMLIVDIEGGELDLFRDIPLTGIKKVYVELHQNVIGRVGMKEIFDFFSVRDFHYDQHHSKGGVVLFSHVLR